MNTDCRQQSGFISAERRAKLPKWFLVCVCLGLKLLSQLKSTS